MNGFTKSYRAKWEHAVFRNKVDAAIWSWMCDIAAWKQARLATRYGPVMLERGQLLVSQRVLSRDFKTTHKKVRTLFRRLGDEGMIALNTQHSAANAGAIVTILNYEKYQNSEGTPLTPPKGTPRAHLPSEETPTYQMDGEERAHLGHTSGTPQGTPVSYQEKEEKEKKEGKEQKDAPDGAADGKYRFAGEVVRLNESDYTKWQGTCPTLVHLGTFDSVLRGRDHWLQRPENAARRKDWFHSTSRYLENENRKAAIELQAAGNRHRRPGWKNPDAIDTDDPEIAAMLRDPDMIDVNDPDIAAMLGRAGA